MGRYDEYDADDVGKTVKKFQCTLFVINVIALVASLATFAVCLWIR
jgi:hypothetical protein